MNLRISRGGLRAALFLCRGGRLPPRGAKRRVSALSVNPQALQELAAVIARNVGRRHPGLHPAGVDHEALICYGEAFIGSQKENEFRNFLRLNVPLDRLAV